jgi:hypothetical protein
MSAGQNTNTKNYKYHLPIENSESIISKIKYKVRQMNFNLRLHIRFTNPQHLRMMYYGYHGAISKFQNFSGLQKKHSESENDR